MDKLPLGNIKVVITRPEKQASDMVSLCQSVGIEPVLSPMLEVSACDTDIAAIASQLVIADWAIFTSTNAVDYTMALFKSQFPPDIQIACIGKKSAAALIQYGFHSILVPTESFNSEGLLNLPLLQTVNDRVIIIFTGKSGRRVLADEFTTRGASVTVAEVYQRNPTVEVDFELKAQLAEQKIAAVFISSGEILQNFMSLYRESVTINAAMVFIVASKRIADIGKELGINEQRMVVAESAHDEAMLHALISWRKGELE